MTDYEKQVSEEELGRGSTLLAIGNENPSLSPTLVIGIGGGGINSVSHMIEYGITGVDFAVIDTDKIMLEDAKVSTRLLIGQNQSGGCGAGGNSSLGECCAESDAEGIRQLLSGYKAVFLVAGFGGGTGTGATPVVAKMGRDAGALVVAFVTTPFTFKGFFRDEFCNK